MRIAIVAPSPVPFVFGGAERFWLDLTRAINERTPHEAELFKIPFPERDFWEVLAGYQRFMALDLSGFDAVISTKYPAWMVRHPCHIVYLQHKLRGLYDAYPGHLEKRLPRRGPWRDLVHLLDDPTPTPAMAEELFERLATLRSHPEAERWFTYPGPAARAVVHFLDRMALAPGRIRRYAAISKTVAEREDYFPIGVDVAVLPHPSGLAVTPTPVGDTPVLFTASRLESPKRIDLIIRAFRRVPGAYRLEIAGSGPLADDLRRMAADDERIRFLGRVSDTELAMGYQRARAVVFIPLKEDLGLITLEAMSVGRPVITCLDSGGPLEFVEDGVNGLVTPAEETALAAAMQRLLEDKALAARQGMEGQKQARTVTWDRVIAGLGLNANSAAPAIVKKRRSTLVLAPFDLRPPRAGGGNRIFHLYRHWARHEPVRILCVGGNGGVFQPAPGLTVEEIPWTEAFLEHTRRWERATHVSSGDLALLDGMDLLPGYRDRVRQALVEATRVVLSHPYTLRALPPKLDQPLIYDAHNVEVDLKRTMWEAAGAETEAVMRLVREAEAETLARASALLAVSDEEIRRFQEIFEAVPQIRLVVPNGVDLRCRPFAAEDERKRLRRRLGITRPLAIFVGSLHYPNVAGLSLLLEAAAHLPEVVFAVAGSVCAHASLANTPANVMPLGVVDEHALSVLLRAAHIGINPVSLGAGTNLKVLDYAACGATIVSTAFGARGLPLRHRKHAWIAEGAGLIAGIDRLCRETQLRTRLAESARQVAERYGWERIAMNTLQAMETVR